MSRPNEQLRNLKLTSSHLEFIDKVKPKRLIFDTLEGQGKLNLSDLDELIVKSVSYGLIIKTNSVKRLSLIETETSVIMNTNTLN